MREKIYVVLFTTSVERIMLPDFGVGTKLFGGQTA
jgi:hypothetical protein